ncbi:MAG: hypothetical protein HXY53_09840 [Nitrospirae bacterium]|nr:hypothetical protein [Nitrospirota bacterium]
MIDINRLKEQIKRNCNISDAKHWGFYSICGLLLRLRELYRSEHEVGLWEKLPQKEVGEWIFNREILWKQLENEEYGDITIKNNTYKPFDIENINTELKNEGLLYGAGLGINLKPSFFLAEIMSQEKIGGYECYITGHEYARDLSNYPAMLQDKTIFVRIDPLKQLLWQRFEELRCKNTKSALTYAFSRYGISSEDLPSADTERQISQIATSEAETFIHHEIGEAFEEEIIGSEWKEFLTYFPHTKAEIFVRSLKDMLSDTSDNGMLKYIIANQKEGSLGFYIVFLTGMRKVLFPEIIDAFNIFTEKCDWSYIDKARKLGYKKAMSYVERLLSKNQIYKNEKDLIAKYIEDSILKKDFSL